MNDELRFTLIRMNTYGISKEKIEEVIEKLDKEITKTTGDWRIEMNSYLLDYNDDEEETTND